MIQDLELGALGQEARADVCIVGAGPAGVTLALELSRRGKTVILAESGGLEEEPETQTLSEGESIGHPMHAAYGRHRLLGGASTQWTGRCTPLDAIDFEVRSWIQKSGWPIAAADLEPYYDKAAVYCGFRAPWSRLSTPPSYGWAKANLDPNAITPYVWRHAPVEGTHKRRDFGAHFRDELAGSKRVRIILHGNLVAINFDGEASQVSNVELASLGGARLQVVANDYVLCCGGLENVRLLLQAAEKAPSRVAENLGAAGRYFMQHPRGRIARVKPANQGQLQQLFNVFSYRGAAQHELGFTLPIETQRREQLLNCSAILTYDANPNSAWESFKRGVRNNDWRDIAAGASRPGEMAPDLWRFVMAQPARQRDPSVSLVVDLEQTPDPESRVTLSDARDALGLKRVRIDWRVGELERTTARRCGELISSEFARLGLGEVQLEPWLFADGPIPPTALTDTFHHIGGTRMTRSPSDGVVDAQCRTHAAANLYVQGSSVFPTGGHANPTLTIVAMALRQAEIIAKN